MKSVFVIALAVCFVGLSSAGPIVNGFAGKCPDIPFVPNFNATGFLGSWFAIKETGRKIPCVTYNLEELAPGHYKSTVYPKKFSMEFTKKNVETFAEGMTVDFKVNPFMDGGVLKVVATDYSTYAAIYVCKQTTPDLYFPTLSIWSRAKTLNSEKLKDFDDIFAKYDVDVSFLHFVSHDECFLPEVSAPVKISITEPVVHEVPFVSSVVEVHPDHHHVSPVVHEFPVFTTPTTTFVPEV